MAELQMESPAATRRQGVVELAGLIAELESQQDRQHDFQVFTYPVVRRIGRLIARLSASGQEQIACEILRQIRDSFLDGGWEAYRDETRRRGVVAILETHLGRVDEIDPAAIQQAFDGLLALGLRPVPMLPGLLSVSPDEEADGEQQDQVPG